jgi:hypothetical protein
VPAGHAKAADHFEAEIAMQSETIEWSGSTASTAKAAAPMCGKCSGGLAFVGKLPAVRLLPSVEVYKCTPCNHVVSMRP